MEEGIRMFFTPGAELTVEWFLGVVVTAIVVAWALIKFVWLPGYEEERRQSEDTLRSMMHDPTLLDAIDGTKEEWNTYQKKRGWK